MLIICRAQDRHNTFTITKTNISLYPQREGLSQYNKLYEFQHNVLGHQAQMVMTSVSGHLLALDFQNEYRNWKSFDPIKLFEAPVTKFCPERSLKIKLTLEREVSKNCLVKYLI